MDEVNPVEDYTGRGWELSFSKPRLEKPAHTIKEAIEKGLTFDSPWYLTVTLKDTKIQKTTSHEIYVGDFPAMTDHGTFIINGIEKVVVNQLTRSEGVLFTGEPDPASGKILAGAKVLPKNGAWLEFETSKSGILSVRIDRRRKITATTLLRLFGFENNDAIKAAFSGSDTGEISYIDQTLKKDPAQTYNQATIEIFKKMRPGEPAILENAKVLIESRFFNPRRYNLGKTGRFKLNLRLGVNFPNDRENRILHKEDLVKVIEKVININNGKETSDDVDHLGNRRVRAVGELLQHQVRVGFLQAERNIRERMSLQPRDTLCDPQALISPRPISARVHSFFASSQLSQYQDQYNPLAGLDHLRRLSVMGPGGLTRERASFSVRDAHYSHYGRICPVKTPEGPNIGLITYIALYARVNEYGFLETPYRKIIKTDKGSKVTDEITYMAAYDEDTHFITEASITVDEAGFIKDKRVNLRHKGEFFIGDVSLVDYVDVLAEQVVGVSAALIPFLANDNINRALVGTQQSAQSVPLLTPHAPFIGTGLEEEVANNAGCVTRADGKGKVTYADAGKISVQYDSGKEKTYVLQKFVQSNMDTCYNQVPLVLTGQKVKEGEILLEGPSCENGEIALGANLTVAYMPWCGYNYEDGIVISERLVKDDVLSSIHITDHTVSVLETKLGPEEITRDIPNVSADALRNLDEWGIVVVGSKVKSGDILVGKIAPKGESELSAEERLLRSIFGEKAREVRDNSLVLPHGEYGTVIGVRILSREDSDELPTGVLQEIKVLVAQIRKIMVGDKLAGRHGDKGVISKIVPVEDMPHMTDGTPIDIIISPHGPLKRMNVGGILEAHLGLVAKKKNQKYALPVFGKFSTQNLLDELKSEGFPASGKMQLFDGRTGEPFAQDVVVGNSYILKLYHLAEDKMHARSTGPYSLITQQPLGGKARFGGQRFGEMEVWALEAYGAAHTLQEMLTIKSDDVVGRTQAFRAIIQGEKIPEATVPESFKLLIRELNGLCLDVETQGTASLPKIVEEVKEESKEPPKEILEEVKGSVEEVKN